MARTAQIHYRLMTFSLPRKVAEDLVQKIPKNERSAYVAKALEQKLEKEAGPLTIEKLDQFFEICRENAKRCPGKSAVELVREFRYGKPRWEK